MEKALEFPDVTSMMAFFVILVNAWKLLTNVTDVTKSSILDATRVLDIPPFLCVNMSVFELSSQSSFAIISRAKRGLLPTTDEKMFDFAEQFSRLAM